MPKEASDGAHDYSRDTRLHPHGDDGDEEEARELRGGTRDDGDRHRRHGAGNQHTVASIGSERAEHQQITSDPHFRYYTEKGGSPTHVIKL